jgi:hypothetical protein
MTRRSRPRGDDRTYLRFDFGQFVGDVEWLACAESSSGYRVSMARSLKSVCIPHVAFVVAVDVGPVRGSASHAWAAQRGQDPRSSCCAAITSNLSTRSSLVYALPVNRPKCSLNTVTSNVGVSITASMTGVRIVSNGAANEVMQLRLLNALRS